MIKFIVALLALIFAVWLGLHIAADPGYALFSYGQWNVEMPLWFCALAVLILFLFFHWLIRLFHFSNAVSGKVRLWSNKRRLRNAQYRTNQGLIDLSEGNWRRAEKNLIKAAREGDSPLINYLAGAKAAQEQGAYERRDNYLRKAHHSNPDAKIAIELTQAELQIQHKQWEQALATLCHLRELTPKHTYVAKLLFSVYLELKDWQHLKALIPFLKQHKIIPEQKLHAVERTIYQHLLQDANDKSMNEFESIWSTMPKALKQEQAFNDIYCQRLLTEQKNVEAEQFIKDSLKKDWNRSLLKFYSAIPNVDKQKQLLQAEYWLKSHPNDVDLLLCLARLYKVNQLWGKARTMLENINASHPNTESYVELAQLYEHLNEEDKALDCYRKAIMLQKD